MGARAHRISSSVVAFALVVTAAACAEDREDAQPERTVSPVIVNGLIPTDLPNVTCLDGTRLSASLDGADGADVHLSLSAGTSTYAEVAVGGWFEGSGPPSAVELPTIGYGGFLSYPATPTEIASASALYDSAITQANCPQDEDVEPMADAGAPPPPPPPPGDGGLGVMYGPNENPPCNTEYRNYNSSRWQRTVASLGVFISPAGGFLAVTGASFGVANARRTFASCCDTAEGTNVQANWTTQRCRWLYNHSWPFDPHS